MMKKNTYEAYTKVVNGRTHYIIKKYEVFPDRLNLPPIFVAMGMDPDFRKATRLAQVDGADVIQELMDKLELANVSGEIVPVAEVKNKLVASKPLSLFYPLNWISKLKWAHI